MRQLIISLRNFKHSPMLLFVNLPGLAIGLAAFLLLMVYLLHETSYDQHFETKDRVVRLYNQLIEENSSETYPICLRKAYNEIPREVPEIEKACQIYRGWGQSIKRGEDQFVGQEVLYADAEFFQVFGLPLLEGNASDALLQKNQLVLTETLANKVFGTTSCLGEMIKLDGENYTVSGVIQDMPLNTHFHFDILCSMNSINPDLYMGGLEFFTYYLLKENSDKELLGNKIAEINSKKVSDQFNSFNLKVNSGVEPLAKLHLYTKADFDLSPKGSLNNILLIAVLAFFILLIAIANFMNLYIFYGEKRLLEIGIRKTLGAGLLSLRKLFYLETAILGFIAFGFAFLLAAAGLNYFSRLMQVDLSMTELFTPSGILFIVLFFVILVFLAGSYPAHYLSSINTIDAIKGGTKTLNRKKWLAISSVVLQFFISIFLIVSVIIIHAQISFMKEIPLGFSSNQVIGISGFNERLGAIAKAIKQELEKLTFVQNVGTSSHFMGGGVSGQGIYKFGESEENTKSINQYRVQAGFCESMQFQLVNGRFFRDTPEDKNAIILNEEAVKLMDLKDPIGQNVIMFDEQPLEIIGIVKDFYYNENTGKNIQALCLTAYSDEFNAFYLKIIGDDTKEKREAILNVFIDFLPDNQLNTFALKEVFDRKYQNEERFYQSIFSGTLLAIFLSFIGMIALSVYNVERRTKEIGLRKVHGSTSLQVLMILLSEILIWVFWAMIPAFLAAFISMRFILSNFANRVELSLWYFLFGGAIAFLIGILAISFKSYQAASQNPVECLRYE